MNAIILSQICSTRDKNLRRRLTPHSDFDPPKAAAPWEDGHIEERSVVAEYPSLEKAIAAYDSPAYAEALKALGEGAVRDFRIVEGLE